MSGRRVAEPTRKSERTAHKAEPKGGVLKYIGIGLSWGLLAVVLGTAAIVTVVPWIAGATPMTVLTQSMEPGLPPGTLVVIKPTPIKDIHLGSVITYQIESGKPEVITHRVIQIAANTVEGTTFITKGDNNGAADPNPITEGQVKGTLWYSVPYIGWVNNLIGGTDRSWIFPVAGVLLLGYAGYTAVSGLFGSKKKKAKKQAKKDAIAAAAASIPPLAPTGAPTTDTGRILVPTAPSDR